MHWATTSSKGGQRVGASYDAEDYTFGIRRNRPCLGYLYCNNPRCEIMVRPPVKRENFNEAIGSPCACNQLREGEKAKYMLRHHSCPNKSVFKKYKYGVYYHNGVPHNHDKFTKTIHFDKEQRMRLQNLVYENPKAGAAALRSGNTISGDSLIKISGRFINKSIARDEVARLWDPGPSR